MVDTQWVMQQVAKLGRIGVTPEKGRTRLCYTAEAEAGRQFVRNLMAGLGLDVRQDAVGNLFGRLEGADPTLPPILVGSHVDTVPNAGAYDGCLGVLAAVGVVRGIIQSGDRPRYPIEIVSFEGEESSRFGLGTIGSRAFAGALDPEGLHRYCDASGLTLGQALAALGADAEAIREAAAGPGQYRAYLELHIDQGVLLDAVERSVGVVTAIAAPERWQFTIHGEAAHSGAALMDQRKDALMAAAHILSQVEGFAQAEAAFQTVVTIGQLVVRPNAMNVVPGEVTFSLDVRSIDTPSRDRLVANVRNAIDRELERRGMTCTSRFMSADRPIPMDRELQDRLTASAAGLAVSQIPVPSLAGHDAIHVADICPAAMLLCRNVSRTSHSPAEQPDPAHMAEAIRVLDVAVRGLAECQ